MPDNSSQGMQAFKSNFSAKTPTLSRENSGSGIPVLQRRLSRERSGEIHHHHDHPDHGHTTGLSVPAFSRRKSDLDRENKGIPSYQKKDYSGVRGSGYGTSTTPKKKRDSPSNASTPMARTPSQPKITRERSQPKIARERSGDVYSRLYNSPPKTTASGATPRTSTSSASPRGGVSTRTSVSGSVKGTPKRVGSTSATKETKIRTPSAKAKTSITSPRSSVSSTDESPSKGATPKTQGGSVFERLSSQTPATKRGSKKEDEEKKTATPKGRGTSTKQTPDSTAKRRTSAKK